MRWARGWVLALGLLLGLATTGTGIAENLTRTSGTILGFDDDAGLVSVQTRLGQRSFFASDATLVFVNRRPAGVGELSVGAQADVAYRFDTMEARRIFVTREASVRGKVGDVDGDEVRFRVEKGAFITLDTDDQTVFSIEGIRVPDGEALIGLQADAVYEPANQSPLLLRLNASASEFRGRVVEVDDVAGTLRVKGSNATRTFTLGPLGVIRLKGVLTDLEDVPTGVRVLVAWRRQGGTPTALAVRSL